MSTAKPTDWLRRVAVYRAQNRTTGEGYSAAALTGAPGASSPLTPRQARRVRHKLNELKRGTARHGRLRRRFDRKDQREVKAVVRELVSIVRARKGARR